MGRYSTNKSYAHRCRHLGAGTYRISWTNDRYYKGSRLRFPTRTERDTDEVGARRFCQKWGVEIENPTLDI